MDCTLPGFSVHGILQARILECVTIAFSKMKEGGHKDYLLCDSIYMKRPEEIKSRSVVVRLLVAGKWWFERKWGGGGGDFLRVQGSFGVKVF